MAKYDEGNTFKNNILNNLHRDIEDMIKRKMKSWLGKNQSIFNDELQVLRKELESKNKNNLTHLLSIPQLHLEDNSNNTNESERE